MNLHSAVVIRRHEVKFNTNKSGHLTEEVTLALILEGQMCVRQSSKLTRTFQDYGIVCAQKRKMGRKSTSGEWHVVPCEQDMCYHWRAAGVMNEHGHLYRRSMETSLFALVYTDLYHFFPNTICISMIS